MAKYKKNKACEKTGKSSRTALFFANAAVLSLVSIISRAVGVSFNAYIAQKVGEECMGLFTLVTSVYGLALVFATSGINLAVVRLVSETLAKIEKYGCEKPKRALASVVRSALIYSILFGSAAGAVVYFAAPFIGNILLGDARTVLSLKVFALSLAPIAVSSALAGYFTGIRKVYKNAVISVTEQIVKILIIMSGIVLIAPRGIEWACVAIVGGGAVAEGASLVSSVVMYLTDRIKPCEVKGKYSIEKCSLRRVASLALPVALGTYARQGLLTAEHLAIPRGLAKYGMNSSSALAAYGVMHGMVMPLVLFPSAVLGSFAALLVPELSESHTLGDTEHIKRIGEKVFRASFLFSVCVAGIFLSFAKPIGIGIYKSAEAARQLRLISALVPVMYLDSAVDSMLKGLGEEVYCMKVNVADSALCLALVFVLVPLMGIDGYILLTIISEIINAAFSITRLLKVTSLRVNVVKWLVFPVISIIVSTGIVHLLGVGNISFQIALCAVLYIVICFLLKSIKKEDFAIGKILMLPINSAERKR